ncbi:MAG: M28 family peptidase [Bacteroidales bacterium]|jgi:hypothetical protein|nr:M28 family peptidase [Bacteroidales bacterium]
MAKNTSLRCSIVRTDFFSRIFDGYIRLSERLQNKILFKPSFTILIFGLIFGFSNFAAKSQSYKYAFYCLDTLTSKTMAGRGYQDSGDLRAATFIANEMRTNCLKPLGKTYFQPFDISINNINTTSLCLHHKDSAKQVGIDFAVSGFSPTIDLVLKNEKAVVFNFKSDLKTEGLNGKTLIFNQNVEKKNRQPLSYYDVIMFLRDVNKAKIVPTLVIIQGFEKIQYPISTKQGSYPVLLLKSQSFGKKIDYLHLTIESQYIEKYKTQNVWAMAEGTKCKDSFFVFAAHYDHLGRCGTAYYPGAADNASGTSVVMDLAKYFSANPPEYSVVFIFFSGEEIGLLGSSYAADHPLIDLSKIKFFFNLDMCGTGSGGVAVINGKKEEKAGKWLQNINNEHRYFLKVNLGEESCNSDHCPFVKKGVPAHFLFTYGCEYNEYHTPYDTGENLGFTKHLDFCNLLKEFVATFR